MAENIKREAAIKAMEKADYTANADDADSCKADYLREIIESVSSADVAPVVHGRWEEYTRSRYIGCDEYGDPRYVDGVVYYCSNPRCRRRTVIKERYCPSCGAKMDGGAIDD